MVDILPSSRFLTRKFDQPMLLNVTKFFTKVANCFLLGLLYLNLIHESTICYFGLPLATPPIQSCRYVRYVFFLQAVLVHTSETVRVRYFLDLLMETRKPVMLVGNAGVGKTVLIGDKFASLDPDVMMVANVPFNYYTTSAMLQSVLEKPLEKKAGRNYGPPGTKRLIYFIDDMNMPEVGADRFPRD